MLHNGLSENEVSELRKKFGENLISVKEETSWFSILLSQLKSPLIYIVALVGLISLLFQNAEIESFFFEKCLGPGVSGL